MRSAAAAVLAVLLPAAAHAAPLESVSAGAGQGFVRAAASPGFDFSAVRAAYQVPPPGTASLAAPGTFGAPAARAPLDQILDNTRRARTAFTLGGTVVRVFGGKSRNKKEWFVGFAANGQEAQWRNGRRMIHWMFLNRSVRVEIGGRAFQAFLKGKLTDKMRSVLRVEPEDGSPAAQWTVQELSDAAYDAGFPVTLGGREYRLVYTRDFDQDDSGEFSGYASDRSLSLMTRDGGRLIGYHWFEREIPSGSILVSSPRQVGADGPESGRFTVGLRRDGRTLELYEPR